MALDVERRYFTVDEYYRMAEAGILTEDDRVELIEGEILRMSPIGSRHAACVNRLVRLVSRLLGDAVVVAPQNPIQLSDDTQPEPDIGVLRSREDFYASGHPRPADVLLVVEVAETTLRYDRRVKGRIYAAAGIPEYWLVDLVGDSIEVYLEPAKGKYRVSRQLKRGESIQSASIAELVVRVEEILG